MSMQETNVLSMDNLWAANQVMPVVSDTLTIAKAGKLTRGTLLDSAGAAATSTVYAVLAEDVDTTDAAKAAPVYRSGEFNASALTAGSGATVSGLKVAAQNAGIYIK